MATKFAMTRDINGYNGFGLDFADDNKQTNLASGVAQTLTIPSNAGMGSSLADSSNTWIAIFSYEPGTKVWVANNVAATTPGGAFSSTSSQLNPSARRVKAGDVLSFITDNTTAEVSVALYSLSL